jgi:hypothetical protein
MPRSRFVEPETVRLELSDGDWIEIKKELTYGEAQRVAGSALSRVHVGGKAEASIDLEQETYQVLRLYTWLVDWSFAGKDGRRVRISKDAIGNLQSDTVAEIDAALTAHITAQDAEKNALRTLTVTS